MAYHSSLHHSFHPNMRQPYPTGNSRPSNRMGGGNRRDDDFGGGPLRGNSNSSFTGSTGGASGFGSTLPPRNTLWMGNIDESLNENVITSAFQNFGVDVTNVKIIRNKVSGQPLGYGFVSFPDRSVAQEVLRSLNGKPIPNAGSDDKRFFLKPSSRQPQTYSVFVGNLTPEIDGDILKQAFVSIYPSVSSARVISSEGQSKCYGFVNFEEEYDFRQALATPNMMLGDFPITIGRARNPVNRQEGGPGGDNMGGGGGGGGRNGGDRRNNNGFDGGDNRDRGGRGGGRDYNDRM